MSSNLPHRDFVPALRFPVLTPWYDRLVALTVREARVDHKVLVTTLINERQTSKDNLGALDVTLSPEHVAMLDAVSAVEPVFPVSILKGPAEGFMMGGVTVEERG